MKSKNEKTKLEDGPREIADVFEDYNQAYQFGGKAGFDLVEV